MTREGKEPKQQAAFVKQTTSDHSNVIRSICIADDFFSWYHIACIYDFLFRNGNCAIVNSPHQGQMGNRYILHPPLFPLLQ